MQAGWPCDSADPLVLEKAVAEREATWSIWQACIDESHSMSLEYWTKALKSSVEMFRFLEISSATGRRTRVCNHRLQSYHVIFAMHLEFDVNQTQVIMLYMYS